MLREQSEYWIDVVDWEVFCARRFRRRREDSGRRRRGQRLRWRSGRSQPGGRRRRGQAVAKNLLNAPHLNSFSTSSYLPQVNRGAAVQN